MVRLYANENFPFTIVLKLRDLGWDVLTSLEAENAGKAVPDEDVLAFAISENRAVITLNYSDFKRLHRLEPKHCGIVICKVDNDFERFTKRIDSQLRIHNSLHSLLIRITNNQ